ncbi:NACHT domain-containing protein [Actinokineospora terrae]|uniref:NACHT domain-containing protein n=1 Tax=Actinokineospora terrae TaxID=155974 RepID=A0A1H9S5R6_9PSEU|nr:NACHT domain-containing protein [Actinokineospora terrae]SER79693.1 NACHT domain-containing protein [Actinokineospora terrae]
MRVRMIGTTGYLLVALAIAFPAAAIPYNAWFSQGDSGRFDQLVGWANVMALPVGAIGLLILIFEKASKQYQRPDLVDADVSRLAAQASRTYKRSLAQLLAVEGPEFRSISLQVKQTSPVDRRSGKLLGRDELVAHMIGAPTTCLAIQGVPGSGKTVLAMECAQVLNDLHRETGQIAVVLSIAGWNPNVAQFDAWVAGDAAAAMNVDASVASSLLRDHRLILILDGLDEIDGELTKGQAKLAVRGIADYVAQTPRVRILITCRSGGVYLNLLRRLPEVQIMSIENPDPGLMLEFLETHLVDGADRRNWSQIAEAIRSGNEALLGVLKTPWQMTSAVAYYRGGGDPGELLPSPGSASHGGESRRQHQGRVRDLLTGNFISYRVASSSRDDKSALRDLRRLASLAALLVERRRGKMFGGEIYLPQWWRMLGESKIRRRHAWLTFAAVHYPWVVSYLDLGPIKEGGLSGIWLVIAVMANQFTIYYLSVLGSRFS